MSTIEIPSDRVTSAAPPARPLRIGYIVSTFNYGGLERCAAWLVNHLDRTRFEPMVICFGGSGAAAEWIEDSSVPVINLGKGKGNDPTIVWKLAKTMRRQQLDLVHSHNWGTLVETVLARRLGGGPRHLHAEHGLEVADLEAHPLRRKLRGMAARWALGRVDRVVAVAEALQQRIQQRCGFPAGKIEVIPNGVEVKVPVDIQTQADKLRAALGIPLTSFVIGSLGRLAPVKNFAMAINVLKVVVERGLDAHLVLIGDGPLLSELREHAAAQGIAPRVHFAGQQSSIAPWLALLDVYLNTSVSEAMSLSILEAMAVGLPCVVTDVGANALLVGGPEPCGEIVPSGATTDMVQSVQRLAADADLRRQFGRQARQRHLDQYSVMQMVRRYESAYEAICHADRGRSAVPQ